MSKRVVITGMGVISPIGNDINTYWNNLLDGVCGIDYIKSIPTDELPEPGLDSGEGGNINPLRFGVYVGSGIGGLQTMIRETEKMISEGTKWVSPLFIPTMISNIAAGNIARCCRCS